ncbi:DUF2634 domain-containing protein [Paenibacillus macquariensis]|uniref:DUF2634 domain-containing protein n=1 Tax=Paenibacillus macquariensis TaxID=948756 RepID=A0ABY1JXA2_9BACL|nr:DUF2634 domain-containing protein [Paenibacillus macquariensis]MEC0089323.1 DUF2634 domain-containing protein [Paenibacillus macquariensis]OAB33275.1 hypothetical protein PMSM_14780 [Paenibacillus macquariensis subsp. macquariensis]SIQ93825.1 Protein of unknown function [Paenibacillus macquariensis]
MIPQSDIEMSDEELEPVALPSRTYKLDLVNKRISSQTIDGLEAIKQVVFKILSTTRFEHLIYSNDFGSEVDLSANRGRSVFESEIERWVKEALTQDDRIIAVTSFKFAYELDNALIQFTVETEYGRYQETKEVGNIV